MKKPNSRKIFIHLPAYREPELIPTIKSVFLKLFNNSIYQYLKNGKKRQQRSVIY